MILIKLVAFFLVYSMTLKFCLGVVTVAIMTMFYVKFYIIHKEFGPESWNYYAKWIGISMVISILASVGFVLFSTV